MAEPVIPHRHPAFILRRYVSVMPENTASARSSRWPISRRQVLAGAGGTGLLAAAASPARAATRTRRSRAGDGTPEQIHLTWGDQPATGVVVSWASPGQA